MIASQYKLLKRQSLPRTPSKSGRQSHALRYSPQCYLLRRGTRSGVAAVEFAVVAPLLLLMVFAMLELGRGLMVQQILTTASITGARRAATVSARTESVTQTILAYTESLDVHGVTAEVSPNPAIARLGEPISVTVSVDFEKVSWLPAPWFLQGKSLSATTVMRKEGFPILRGNL